MQQLKDWLGLVAIVISVGTVVWGWLSSGEKAVAADLKEYKKNAAERDEEVDDALEAHDRRIQLIESELKHLPDKDSVVELKLTMAELKGTVGRLDESLNSVQRTVLRIDDYLRQGVTK